ncbi:hypothetical protein [Paenibacillus sp. OSY-SE]|uniref:hypothetical protein n=1 Tax=Paenibacillus sp. OSY-SE TaxID=1196323 RepID=UPI0002E77587|nr:hypothetical protein [Paenibacillus sp. OSY-SE]
MAREGGYDVCRDEEFKYDYKTTISAAVFQGIEIHTEIDERTAHQLLERYVQHPNEFTLIEVDGQRKFVFRK